jgi:sugar fermentation stimulation protein A
MIYSEALHKAKLLRRYKRFLADAELEDGTLVTAHCPNTGSMESCYTEGCVIWLSYNDSPTRKLKWTWEYTQTPEGLIGINTARPNQVVAMAVEQGFIPGLTGYKTVRREVKYGKNSRIDLLLESPDRQPCYVEIKNATLRRGEVILFPDAVTERGLKHLGELSEMTALGHRAVMLFFVNRPDGRAFTVADDIDPKYGVGLRAAIAAGVEVLAIRASSTQSDMTTGASVPIEL